jgi:hypothetical protein
MSNSKDKGGVGNNTDPDEPYKVGNKKPPLHTRFPKGKSGNPGGRPKGSSKNLAYFGDILMKEFSKTVPANIAGQTVNKTQGEILAQVMMKNAITTKRASHIALLLKFMEAHESRLAALEAVKLKQVAEGSIEIDWDDEKEKAYQELVARAGRVVQSTPNA